MLREIGGRKGEITQFEKGGTLYGTTYYYYSTLEKGVDYGGYSSVVCCFHHMYLLLYSYTHEVRTYEYMMYSLENCHAIFYGKNRGCWRAFEKQVNKERANIHVTREISSQISN